MVPFRPRIDTCLTCGGGGVARRPRRRSCPGGICVPLLLDRSALDQASVSRLPPFDSADFSTSPVSSLPERVRAGVRGLSEIIPSRRVRESFPHCRRTDTQGPFRSRGPPPNDGILPWGRADGLGVNWSRNPLLPSTRR